MIERTRARRTDDVAPPPRRARPAADRQPGEGQRGDSEEDRDERFDMGGEDMR